MKKDSAVYENLQTELEDYEKKGVCILIDGNSASPMQVVRQHMVREAGSYMRDYEIDPEGHIESLSFVNINEKYRKNRRQKGQRAARRNSPFIQNG